MSEEKSLNADKTVEALQFISKTQREAFENRKKVEWKIIFMVITFYVLSVAAKIKGQKDFPNVFLIWIPYILIAVISSIFLLFLHMAHFMNKCSAHKAEHEIHRILESKPRQKSLDLYSNNEPFFSWKALYSVGKAGVWSWVCQTIILILFAICAAIFMTFI